MIRQGEVWWADLGDPQGSVAGFRRPVIVVQGDHINESRIGTAICVLLTSNLKWGVAPTNLKLPSSATGLLQDSIAQTTHILAVDKRYMIERIGRISQRQLEQLFACLDIALGRSGG